MKMILHHNILLTCLILKYAVAVSDVDYFLPLCSETVDEMDEMSLTKLTKYQGQPEMAYMDLAKFCIDKGFYNKAVKYLNIVIQLKHEFVEAYILLAKVLSGDGNLETQARYLLTALHYDSKNSEASLMLGNIFWGARAWNSALENFEVAYESGHRPDSLFVLIVYLRKFVCKWGPGGYQHEEDMQAVERIIRSEMTDLSLESDGGMPRQSAVHPYMALGFAISSELKLVVARSHALAEKAMVARTFANLPNFSRPLSNYKAQSMAPGFRIKVGYVSANIKSKTTVYMAQDLWRFHNRSSFEVHVYATSPPDDPEFLKNAMKGVDWRKKVSSSVEYFHDVSGLDVMQLARLIHSQGIHILLDWDGYSNAGGRATGLFPLQSAPLQLGHQEYIGTMGADFIQYIVTDKTASPPELEHLYSEKFIWMPHSFHANSMPHMGPEMKRPVKKLSKRDLPQVNGCGGAKASFVYCNFNKHMKFTPRVFRSWLRILQTVDESVLCLLEYPKDSRVHISNFIMEFDRDLLDRVRYLPFVGSPYDNQRRHTQMCSAVLDTEVYNGHTTAVDALWAGIPLVTRSDGTDMAARVGFSLLRAVGMEQIVAKSEMEYEQLAVRLGSDRQYYKKVRAQLVAACLAERPRNPYWDLQRCS